MNPVWMAVVISRVSGMRSTAIPSEVSSRRNSVHSGCELWVSSPRAGASTCQESTSRCPLVRCDNAMA